MASAPIEDLYGGQMSKSADLGCLAAFSGPPAWTGLQSLPGSLIFHELSS